MAITERIHGMLGVTIVQVEDCMAAISSRTEIAARAAADRGPHK